MKSHSAAFPVIVAFSLLLLISVVPGLGDAPRVDLSEGLVAYYPFNGNANDMSGHGNNGAVNGAALTVDRFGSTNSAFRFNGAGDFIRVPHSPALSFSGSFTVSAWVKTADPFGALVLQHNGGGDGNFLFGLTDGGKLVFGRSAGFWTSQPVNDGAWHMVTGIYDGSRHMVRQYVDGTLIASRPDAEPLPNRPIALTIGDESNRAYGLEAVIDDVRLYHRALSDDEIRALFAAPASASATPSVQAPASSSSAGSSPALAPAANAFDMRGTWTVSANGFGGVMQIPIQSGTKFSGSFFGNKLENGRVTGSTVTFTRICDGGHQDYSGMLDVGRYGAATINGTFTQNDGSLFNWSATIKPAVTTQVGSSVGIAPTSTEPQTPITIPTPPPIVIPPSASSAVTTPVLSNLVGRWTFCMRYQGVDYNHDMYITSQTSSGVLEANGGYPAGQATTNAWKTTAGSITGNDVALTITYTTGTPHHIRTAGRILPDGTMSGTWTDDVGGGRNGTWTASGRVNLPQGGSTMTGRPTGGLRGGPVPTTPVLQGAFQVAVTPSASPQVISTVDGVSVTIPGGLLQSEQTLTVTPIASPTSTTEPFRSIRKAYQVTLGDMHDFGNKELVVAIPYTTRDSEDPAAQYFGAYYDETIKAWITLPTSISTERKTLFVHTRHLSALACGVVKGNVDGWAFLRNEYFTLYYDKTEVSEGGYTRDPEATLTPLYGDRGRFVSDTWYYLNEAYRIYRAPVNSFPDFKHGEVREVVGVHGAQVAVVARWLGQHVYIHNVIGGSNVNKFTGNMNINLSTATYRHQKLQVAHELFHVLQGVSYSAVTKSTGTWWMEATAEMAAARLVLKDKIFGTAPATPFSGGDNVGNRRYWIENPLDFSAGILTGEKWENHQYATSYFLAYLEDKKGIGFVDLYKGLTEYWTGSFLGNLARYLKEKGQDLEKIYQEYIEFFVFNPESPVRGSLTGNGILNLCRNSDREAPMSLNDAERKVRLGPALLASVVNAGALYRIPVEVDPSKGTRELKIRAAALISTSWGTGRITIRTDIPTITGRAVTGPIPTTFPAPTTRSAPREYGTSWFNLRPELYTFTPADRSFHF